VIRRAPTLTPVLRASSPFSDPVIRSLWPMGFQLPKAKIVGKWAFVIAAAVSIYAQHTVCWFPGFIMILRTCLVLFCAIAFEFPIVSGLGACGVQRFCGVPVQSWDNSMFVKFWFRTIVYMLLSLFWIAFISADSESQLDCKDANGAAVAFFLITCLCYLSAIFINESYDPQSDPSPASLFDCAAAYTIGGDCIKPGITSSSASVHPERVSDHGETNTKPARYISRSDPSHHPAAGNHTLISYVVLIAVQRTVLFYFSPLTLPQMTSTHAR
jgi:hypothetical protein